MEEEVQGVAKGDQEVQNSQRNFRIYPDVPCDGKRNHTRSPNKKPVPAIAHYGQGVDGGVSLAAKLKALEGSSCI